MNGLINYRPLNWTWWGKEVDSMKKWWLLGASVILAAGMILLLFQDSEAGAATGGVTVLGKVNPNIVVSVNTASILLEGVPGSTVTSSSPVVVNVKSNVAYNLSVMATQDLTDTSIGLTLPISRLSWAPAGTGTWTAFSLADTAIATNEPKTLGTGKDYSFDYQFTIDLDDPLGSYTTDIVYTAVAY